MAGGDESSGEGGQHGDDDIDDHRRPGRVRDVYDDIAPHFSDTRAYPWPEVEAFVDGCDHGHRGLDVGCGNGRHLVVLSRRVDRPVGLDVSRNLLVEARERVEADAPSGVLVQGDAAALPLMAGTIDIAVYVATLHHLPDREHRRRSLDELARVLDEGGRALVSAWSTAHDRFDATADAREGFDTTLDWTLPGGETVPRFYHIYAPAEFDEDLAASDLVVEESYVSSGNCYAEVTVATDDSEGKRP
ncbi:MULTISPECIES: class I SAM-dependent methyltransferase [Salinibaculum]|uniref:class I SAM-dependent methyltransferase n=1 Tax=Salinibaculum TaxID=2732368 RepID=UPI0030D1A15B